MVSLVKGFAGKPAHPPLTDIGIGAYTAGVAMLVAGAAGFQQAAMASASVIAIAVGLIAAIPTIITGLVDLFAIPADAPARTLGWWHRPVRSDVQVAAGWILHRQGHHVSFDRRYHLLGITLCRRVPWRCAHLRLRSPGTQPHPSLDG
jgi:hypothetical protein